jgi:hypothetical protein
MKINHLRIAGLLFVASLHAVAGTAEDIKLFSSGGKLTWDSTGHEKAKGVAMKISYPSSWQAAEGSRPNIVQKFVGEAGKGGAMMMVMTKAMPGEFAQRELTEAEKKELLARDVMESFVPDGGKLISYQLTKIDGEACAMLESEAVGERLGFKIKQKMLSLIIPRKGVLLMIQCSVGGDAAGEAVNQQYAQTKPLFLLMASSCVLTDKWRK